MKFARHLSLVLALASVASAQAPYTHRIDVALDGSPVDAAASTVSVSADGKTALFYSGATNLGAVSSVPLSFPGLYAKDLRTGATELVNLGSLGQPLKGIVAPNTSALSADGRFVVFESFDDDVGLNDQNGNPDVYLRDRLLGVTELVSVTTSGGTAFFGNARRPTVSADGRYVTFLSPGLNLSSVPMAGSPFHQHAYLRDRQLAVTTRLSNSLPIPLDEEVAALAISGDGSTVVYRLQIIFGSMTQAIRKYDVATGAQTDVLHVSDVWPALSVGTVSLDFGGTQSAFATGRALLPEDQDNQTDIYTLDLATGALQLASLPTQGSGPPELAHSPSLSPDGRYLAFEAVGSGWVPYSVTGSSNVYLRDLQTGLTTLVSINDLGVPGASYLAASATLGSASALSDGGRKVVYTSNYLNLAAPNAPAFGGNFHQGVYLHELSNGGADLKITGLVAGASAAVSITAASPGGALLVGLSITGQGPFPSYWGLVDLTPPLRTLVFTADAGGTVSASLPLQPSLAGMPLFAKGLDVAAYEPTTSFFGMIQ